MKSNPDKALRQHLLYLLKKGGAHAMFEDAIKDFPAKLRGQKVANFPHTAWMLLEHMRIAQCDILEFSRSAKHASPKWPDGYWPKTDAPPTPAAWTKSVAAFRKDLKSMETLITNPKTDLYAPLALGRRSDRAAGGPAGRRPQRLSRRTARDAASIAGGLEGLGVARTLLVRGSGWLLRHAER